MKQKTKNKIQSNLIVALLLAIPVAVVSIVVYSFLTAVPLPTAHRLDLTEVWNPEEGFVISIKTFDVNDNPLEAVSMVDASKNGFSSTREYYINSTLQLQRDFYGGNWELSKITLNETMLKNDTFTISEQMFKEELIAGAHK